MSSKWIGAFLVFLSCGGCGFSIAAAYRKEENIYKNLIWILSYMKAELQFHLTDLPDLCAVAAKETDGILQRIFLNLSDELKTWTYPDAAGCMQKVLINDSTVPPTAKKLLLELGKILGQFDLSGQIDGLDLIKKECANALEKLCENRDERIRGYRTLGLCAGAALVILFI